MKKNTYVICTLVCLFTFVYTLSSCDKKKIDGGKNKCTCSSISCNDSCKCAKDCDDSTCSHCKKQPIELLKTSVLYLDISESMAGYVNATNESRFQGVVSGLLDLTEQVECAFFDTVPRTMEQDEFLKQVSKRAIKWKKESDLFNMIKTMVNSDRSISILVTDGIMSGSNEDISGHKTYNIDFRETLSNKIKKIVKSHPEKQILVLQYVSNFQGVYYAYDNSSNNKTPVNVKDRPYYVIIIGEGEQVDAAKAKIMASNGSLGKINNGNYLHIGETYKCLVTLGDKLEYDDSDESGKTILIDKDLKDNEKVEFLIDTDCIPEYMQSEDYIRENLKVYVVFDEDVECKNFEIKVDETKVKVRFDRSEIQGYTIKFHIAYKQPRWIDKLTSMDDSGFFGKNSMIEQRRTFNLKYFIAGLQGDREGNAVLNQTFNVND